VAVNPDFLGRDFTLPEPYEVAVEDLRAFADAVGAQNPACRSRAAARALGHPGVVAAPTFAVKIAQRAESLYVSDPAAGIDFARVVHAEERFAHHRPIVDGDRLDATVWVEAINSRGALTTVTTRTEITAAAPEADPPEPVATVWSTLAIRGEQA
jgi:acyl dehydratase